MSRRSLWMLGCSILLLAGGAQAFMEESFGYTVVDSAETGNSARPDPTWSSIIGTTGTQVLSLNQKCDSASSTEFRCGEIKFPKGFDFEFGILNNEYYNSDIVRNGQNICYGGAPTESVWVHLWGFIAFQSPECQNIKNVYYYSVEDPNLSGSPPCNTRNPANMVAAWLDRLTVGPVYYKFSGNKLIIEVTEADADTNDPVPPHPFAAATWQYVLHGGGAYAHSIDVIYGTAYANEASTVGEDNGFYYMDNEAGIKMDIMEWDAGYYPDGAWKIVAKGCIGVPRTATGVAQGDAATPANDYAIRYKRITTPEAGGMNLTIVEDSVISDPDNLFQPNANDPNGFPYEYYLTQAPYGGRLYSEAGVELTGGSTVTGPKLIFVPDVDFSGKDYFEFTIEAIGGISNIGHVNITVLPINDPPRGPVGPNVAVPHSGPTWTDASWAPDGIRVGPPSEQAEGQQFRKFKINNDREDLFVMGPAVDEGGGLTFRARPGCGGVANINLHLQDNGGISHPLDQDTADLYFAIDIAVTPNNPPTMSVGQFLAFQGQPTVIPAPALDSADDESDAWTRSFTITSEPIYGYLRDFDGPLRLGDSFTQRQLDIGAVWYVNEADHLDPDGFEVELTDCMGLASDGGPQAVFVEVVDPLLYVALDTDEDGVPDADDNCPGVINRRQADHDGDGIGDACDPDFLTLAALDPDLMATLEEPDHDKDRVSDIEDNCPTIANALQADQDLDGFGDACDDDIDGDEIVQQMNGQPWDNCPLVPNPTQKDADDDGIGDACDASGSKSVPLDGQPKASGSERCEGLACGATGRAGSGAAIGVALAAVVGIGASVGLVLLVTRARR